MIDTPLYLGLDVGTFGVKAGLVGVTGGLRFAASESYGVSHPRAVQCDMASLPAPS